MALSVCNPIATDAKGRELIQHGTALFPVACYHDDLRQFGVAWHWHEELEVFTVEEGIARVSVNGADHLVRQGEGIFINTGILHGVWREGDGACRLHSMVFHPRFVGGSVDSILWQKYLEPLLSDPSCPCVPFTAAREWEKAASRTIDAAWEACALEEEGFEFRARDLLSQLILILFQNRPVTQKQPSEKALRDGERTKAMLQYIQARYSEELTLTQIAGSANVSESECLRCFRSVIGCSPMQYVKQLRIQRAAELLKSTDWKICDIGMKCGFQEMSYFAKTFREVKGCTPKGYREQK